ncbi:DUF4190 domain-containing protein [Microbacterium sp. NPDC089189]|uniref:DUF4190 domain-containing protein n=1 Tax=Microbacterium sp. NPDC089189 TaxID=3154972 RepID=UPI003442B258
MTSPYAPPAVVYVPRPTSGLAITSFVLALCGLNLLAVIFGHVALGSIRRTGASGAGFAIAGLVIGYLTLIALVVVAIAVVWLTVWAVNVR